MLQRPFIFLAIGLAAIGAALLINISVSFPEERDTVHLSQGEVKAMAVQYKQVWYTLNFEQQEKMIRMINQAIPVGAEDISSDAEVALFTQVKIYRFNAPDILLEPVVILDDGNLIFTLSHIPSHRYLQDISLGEMKRVLYSAFDQ